MDNVNNWLNHAKSNNMIVMNKHTTTELSACFNLLTIPGTGVAALTVTLMRGSKCKHVVDRHQWHMIFKQIEAALEESRVSTQISSETDYFQAVDKSTEWWRILNCQRLYFIPESTVITTILTMFNREHVNQIQSYGICEIYLVVTTTEYQYESKF